MSCTSLSIAGVINESSCNARRILVNLDGSKPIISKAVLPFSNPAFEKDCYAWAKKLILSAATHNGNLDEVDGILETLLTINPESAYPHMGAAELQMRIRELNLAEVTLSNIYREAEIATRIKPILPEAFITLGRAALLMHCVSCAELHAEKAQRLGNTSPELVMLLSLIDEQRGYLTDAKQKLTQALSHPSPLLSPEIKTDFYLRLASLNATERKYTEAKQALNLAIAIDLENPTPLIALAKLQLFWLGDAQAAIKTAKESYQIKPTLDAKKIGSFASYLAWAEAYLVGKKTENINRIMQAAFVSPEEIFVESAKYNGLAKITEAMLKAKVIKNTEVQDGRGNTALLAASMGNNVDLVKLLIHQHANVNAQNSNGERALSFLVLNSHRDAITMLLKAGAEVNYADVDGTSPLSIAVFKQDKAMFNQLVDFGASTKPVLELAKTLGIIDIHNLINKLLPVRI
jgi:AhpD family alkylhydroperoxidase